MKKIYLLTCIIAASTAFSNEIYANTNLQENLKKTADGVTGLAQKGKVKAKEISEKAAPALEKAKDFGVNAAPIVESAKAQVSKVIGKSESPDFNQDEKTPEIDPVNAVPEVISEAVTDDSGQTTTPEETTPTQDPSLTANVVPEKTSEVVSKKIPENLKDTTRQSTETLDTATDQKQISEETVDPVIKAKVDSIFEKVVSGEFINASKAELTDNDIPYFVEQLAAGADAGIEGVTLNLSKNQITTQGLATLLDGIKKYPKLISIIDLSDNPLGDDVTHILFSKDTLPTTKSILLANTNLTGSGILDIMKLIIDSDNAVLEYIDLSRNNATDDYLDLIIDSAKTLKDKGTLKEIDISENQFTNIVDTIVTPENLILKILSGQIL